MRIILRLIPLFFSSSTNWKPSLPGILKSSNIVELARSSPPLNLSSADSALSASTTPAPCAFRMALRIFRQGALSSITSTWLLDRLLCWTASWFSVASRLAVKKKVLPWPSSLSTQILPPIISDKLLEMVRPKPVPPYLRVVEESTWVKLAKIASSFSFGIPIPLSVTEKRKVLLLVSGSATTRRITSPFSVNFRALLIRFNMICLSLAGSPSLRVSIVSSTWHSNSTLLPAAFKA